VHARPECSAMSRSMESLSFGAGNDGNIPCRDRASGVTDSARIRRRSAEFEVRIRETVQNGEDANES
jgi:hypothetical protein